MLGLKGNKVLYNVKRNIAKLFLFHSVFVCLSVCLSVEFQFLNHVTECYKSRREHNDDLGGH
jgi:hypothetical protein